MELVLDNVVAQLNVLKNRPLDQGGFSDLENFQLPTDVWWGDPGIVPAHDYPFIFVEPVDEDDSDNSTTGKDVENLTIRIGIVLDPETYIDEETIDLPSRDVVLVVKAIRRWFKKTSIRESGGLGTGIRGLKIGPAVYNAPQGQIFSRGAQITLTVQKEYPRQQ